MVSVLPSSFALVTFQSFADDSIDVPNTPALQLSQFTIESKFMISQDPTERGYLVSKGSSDGGNVLLDQNYALFLTPLKKIGGGFRASDGSYQYVYSQVITTGVWHSAKLVYDGSTLRITIDGQMASSKTVNRDADNTANGSLRIGANANGPANKFFIGDMDYVKIVDRTTSAKVYFNDFGSQTNSSSDCSEIPASQLRGAVFIDSILSRFENDGGPSAPKNYVQDSMRYIKSNGMNFVRVPFYWESYVSWPGAFMSELELVAQAADANGICVIFDNHHWYTSSYFSGLSIGKSGTPKGFPSFVMQGYPTTGDYETVAGLFWEDFLSNSIVVGGDSIWDLQAGFFKKVIGKVDAYQSVAGYEILNEPHIFDSSQYQMLGEYHTYMAKEIRSVTAKKIVFDRETARGFQRDPDMEFKIVPQGVSGLVYGPHLYSVPTPGSQGQNQVNNFKKWSQEWGVEILLGEWSGGSQDEIDSFVSAFKDSGFGWSYYKWAPAKSSGDDHLGNVIYESDSNPKTTYLQFLDNAIKVLF